MTSNPTTADALVSDVRRAVHEALAQLPAWEADRVRALIADLESAVEGRTAIRMSAASPVGQPIVDAALRDRIAGALLARIKQATVSKAQPFDAVTALLAPTEFDLADAVLAVLPAPPSRAAGQDEVDRLAEWLWDNCAEDERSGLLADDPRRIATVALHWPELRRVVDEEQPAEAPWASDGARIGRALIWSWTDVGKGEFARGYRAAQEEARALLTGQRQPAAADSEETRHTCGNCEGVDPDTCLTNPDRPASPPV